jgi:hypothetical protein
VAGERLFTRIPPASTGPRINYKHTAAVPYTNRTGEFIIGEHVSLGTSGFMMHVHGVDPLTSTTGYILVHYSRSAVFNDLSPQPNENIIFDGVTIAQVHPTLEIRDLFVNTNHITSWDNPDYGLWVDKFGSAQITFAEGQPQLDAFGKLRTSQGTVLGEYVFANSVMPDAFSTRLNGSGSISWDQNKRAALISTSTASGDIVAHTTNTYHHYTPGASHLFMATLALGDVGKVGLGRSWGLFDFQNGVHFVHREDPSNPGQIRLGFVIKSDVTGTVVDNYIWQDDWNRDRLDGTGPSQMLIDLTQDNLYWIDMQWLGAGRVRFGVYHEGQRVVCHEYMHGNTAPYPFCATGSLPACFAQRNFSATGSSSEMRVFCCSVWTEHNFDVLRVGRPGLQALNTTITANDVYEYVGTLAPVELLSNGRTNRVLYIPTELEVLAFDIATGDEALVEVEVIAEPVISGAVWQSTDSPTVEMDMAATWYGGGQAVLKSLVRGHEQIDLTTVFNNTQNGAIKNYSEIGGTRVCMIANITQASPAVITIDEPQHMLREGYSATINDVAGMTEINGQTIYMKITGLQTAELYTDAALTIPLDTTGFSAYASGGNVRGLFGSRFLWTVILKKYRGNESRVIIKTSWKEIAQ